MRRECCKRFPRHRFQRKLVSDPGMHHGTCVTHVGACATRNFRYPVRGPCRPEHGSQRFNPWTSAAVWNHYKVQNGIISQERVSTVKCLMIQIVCFHLIPCMLGKLGLYLQKKTKYEFFVSCGIYSQATFCLHEPIRLRNVRKIYCDLTNYY